MRTRTWRLNLLRSSSPRRIRRYGSVPWPPSSTSEFHGVVQLLLLFHWADNKSSSLKTLETVMISTWSLEAVEQVCLALPLMRHSFIRSAFLVRLLWLFRVVLDACLMVFIIALSVAHQFFGMLWKKLLCIEYSYYMNELFISKASRPTNWEVWGADVPRQSGDGEHFCTSIVYGASLGRPGVGHGHRGGNDHIVTSLLVCHCLSDRSLAIQLLRAVMEWGKPGESKWDIGNPGCI